MAYGGLSLGSSFTRFASMNSRILFSSLFLGLLFLLSNLSEMASTEPAPLTMEPAPLATETHQTDKRVIAHYMMSMLPARIMPDRPADTWQHEFQVAKSIGIDELTLFMEAAHLGDFPRCLEAAEVAASIPDFSVSLCMGIPRGNLIRDWLEPVKRWCDAARDRDGFSKVGERPVIWTYHAGAASIEEWMDFVERLNADGYDPYIVGDMYAHAFNNGDAFVQRIDEWAYVMDSIYFFNPFDADDARTAVLYSISSDEAKTYDFMRKRIVTPRQGYWRWGNDSQGSSQVFRGTAAFTEAWTKIDAERDEIDWVHLTTWNDFLEHTFNMPSRNASDVRPQAILKYASRLKGLEREADDRVEKFWLTAPSELRNGPGGLMEGEYIYEVFALDIADGERRSGKISVADDRGNLVREIHFELYATSPRHAVSWEPAPAEFGESRYLWVTAEVQLAPGRLLSGSLPVLIWPEEELDRVFYKAPRSIRLVSPEAIPDAPELSVSNGRLVIEGLPEEGDSTRRVDVLYDMHMKGSEGVNLGTIVTGRRQLPEHAPFDPYYFKRGFRQAATITKDGRVAWARPLWVPEPLPMPVTDERAFTVAETMPTKEGPVRINFQKRNQTPPGYLADTGRPFGNRGNGWHYGWSRNVTAFARERNLHEDYLFDTLIPFNYYLSSWFWEIALPNGTYHVKLELGDAAFKRARWGLQVEDGDVVDPDETPKHFSTLETVCEVVDHRLTLRPIPRFGNAINYIEITPVPSGGSPASSYRNQ